MDTRYYRSVAFALRDRGVAEADIASTLAELDRARAGRDPQAPRTDPAIVASSFSTSRSRSRGRVLGIVGGVVMIIAVAVQVIGLAVFKTDLRAGPFPLFAVSVPLFLACVGIATCVDHRLPRGFTVTG